MKFGWSWTLNVEHQSSLASLFNVSTTIFLSVFPPPPRLVLVMDPNGLSLGAGDCDWTVSIASCGTMLNSTTPLNLFFFGVQRDWSPVMDSNGLSLGAGDVIGLFQLPPVALCWIAQHRSSFSCFFFFFSFSEFLSVSSFLCLVSNNLLLLDSLSDRLCRCVLYYRDFGMNPTGPVIRRVYWSCT